MKRFAVLAVCGMFLAGGARAADPWVIGMIAPSSGPLATVGLRQVYAVQWWAQDVNAKGGIRGRNVEILTCNDEGSPEKAVTCARDLLGKDSVLMINASVTGPIKATMPLVEHGPVMLTPSPNVLPAPSTFVFQVSPSDVDLTRAIASYMKSNHVNRLAMIAATDASGEVGVASAAAIFPPAGIKYDLARIDLRANDASIQLANIAKSDVPLIYSNYSGGGAATVVKSYGNLGLGQPLIVSYANVSDAFIKLIRNDMPHRLLATGIKAVVPDLIDDSAERQHLAAVMRAYQAWKNDTVDQLTLTGMLLADTTDLILRNVADPKNAQAVKDFLERTPIKSVQTIRFAPDRHVGMGADDVAVVEYKKDGWVKADPMH